MNVLPGQPVELRVSNRTSEDYVLDSKESHVPATKEKFPAAVETSRRETEITSTKSEYVPLTKEGMTHARRPQQWNQEEKTSLFDKIVGCIRFCL